MAGSKELVTRFPILFALYLFDNRTHGDDGNFVSLWRQCENPTDGTPVVVKNLLSVEGLHWFLPNVIKNFSGFAPLGAILALVLGAGLAERVGLLPALMVKMASHVNARYTSYMVLFIAFSATFLPMRR